MKIQAPLFIIALWGLLVAAPGCGSKDPASTDADVSGDSTVGDASADVYQIPDGCTPEVINNGVDEDCNGWIDTSYYNVRVARPRLVLDPDTLSRLRQYACYDDAGQVLPSCTPTARFDELVANILISDPDDYGRRAWHFALLYMITGDTAYRDVAIIKLEAQLQTFFTDTRSDSHLESGDVMKNVAYCFDWLYDELDPTLRDTIVSYMHQAAYETRHAQWAAGNADTCPCTGSCPNPDPSNPYDCNWSGWGLHAPLNNYHYSHLMTCAYHFLSTIDQGGDEFLTSAELLHEEIHGPNGVLDNTSHYGVGGGWMEGINYNYPSKLRQFDMYTALKTASNVNYFELSTPFFNDMPLYQIFVIQPGDLTGGRHERVVPIGDLARSSIMNVYDYDWMLIGTAALHLPDGPNKRYAQFWRSHSLVGNELSESGWNTAQDFLLYVQDAPENDYRNLLSYYASGCGFVNARSSWDEGGVSVSFKSTCFFESHQNPDQNTFLIFRDDWQVVDTNTFSPSGIIQDTRGENTLLVGGVGQNERTAMMELNGSPVDPSTCGHIVAFEDASDYVLMEGDASGVYDALSVFSRQILYLRPETVVVHDKVHALSASDTKTSLLHFPEPPSVNGDTLHSINGDGAVFVRVLLPAARSIAVVADDDLGATSSRVEITATGSAAYHTFLNVLTVPPAATVTMAPVTLLDGDTVEGAFIDNTYAVLFGKTTDLVDAATINLPTTSGVTLLVVDLHPNTSYTHAQNGNEITISQGAGGTTTSAAGVLLLAL